MVTSNDPEFLEALRSAYFAGFAASGEGYNIEHPFLFESPRYLSPSSRDPRADADWCAKRDKALTDIMEKNPW